MQEQPFDFVYYAWNELLVGSLKGQSFCVKAVSGGGRGGWNAKHSFASYSPHKGTNKSTGQRGGVLPPGLWHIAPPSKYGGKMKGKPISKLSPLSGQALDFPTREYEKTPFLIHGMGEHGSDGCLVIDGVSRKRLLNAVEDAGGAILLVTLATYPGDRIDQSLTFRKMA